MLRLLVLLLLLLTAEGLLQPLFQLVAPLPLPALPQLLAVVVRQCLVDGQGAAWAVTGLPAEVGRGFARTELKAALIQGGEPGLPALPQLLPLLRGEGVHRLVVHQDLQLHHLRRRIVGEAEALELAKGTAALPPSSADPEDLAAILYTSGSTGRPKGVCPPLPERDISQPGDTVVAMFGGHFGLNNETVYLSPAPLYHAAPLRTCAAVQALGGTAIIMEKFDAETSLALIDRYRVNASQWVPTMFVRMLKLPEEIRAKYDVRSLQVAIHAAAPCPVDVKHEMMRWWGPILFEYYSCTELNGMTIIRPEEWLQKPGSVGKAVLGVIHICDEAGEALSTGQNGLVYFERDVIPFEYHGDEEKTRSTQHPKNPMWTSVGDIGHVDDDGFLFLTDRKAFMIISGGLNIYPQEVENALALHPAISDIAVIGVPDHEMGEQVKAVVTLAPGHSGSPELARQIIDFAKSKVASYKAPRSVDFVETLPRTPTGKLLKGELRKAYLSSATP